MTKKKKKQKKFVVYVETMIRPTSADSTVAYFPDLSTMYGEIKLQWLIYT